MNGRSIRLVVIGLSLSSSWGNGHATTYRALLKAFAARGHHVTFLERDVPWYGGEHRDLARPEFCDLILYKDRQALETHRGLLEQADAVMVGSYVPEGVDVGAWAQAVSSGPVAFYDIDTPVTLAKLDAREHDYISPSLIPGYDPYFSFSGGPVLARLGGEFKSPAARALYCSVDERLYRPLDIQNRWDLSYLGTYSSDRQPALQRLLIEPARRARHLRFAVAGPLYPDDIVWPPNVERLYHVPPPDHAAFYASSRFTLNITRADMIKAGFSPSVRLFEAAACATPIISDRWAGLDEIFDQGRDILVAEHSDDVLALLTLGDDVRRSIGAAGQRRVLREHTAAHRAETMERAFKDAMERKAGVGRARLKRC